MHLPSALLPAARPLPHEKRVLCFQPRAARLNHRRPPPCCLHRLLFLLLRRRLMSLPPPPPPLSAAPHPRVAGSARGTSPAGAAEQGDRRDLTGGSRTSLRREQGGRRAVAGGAAEEDVREWPSTSGCGRLRSPRGSTTPPRPGDGPRLAISRAESRLGERLAEQGAEPLV